jgi:hypothetical protein
MGSGGGLAELRKWLDAMEIPLRRSPNPAQEPAHQLPPHPDRGLDRYPVGRPLPDPVLQLDGSVPVEQVAAEIRERGLDPRIIDLGSISGKVDLLEALHRILELGPWFGFNWDALEEALHGPEGEGASERVLVCMGSERFHERASRAARIFLEIVGTVSRSRDSGMRGCVLIG